uniref:RNA-directed DNA polymerase n=1 Tax=Cacopsylla melanoneura TaxID=428564 RepID=A0A8D8X2M1_9HEMI
MRLALLQYDLDVTYLPGRQMLVADLLSRNFIEKSYDNEIPLQGYVHNLYAVELELSNEVIIREGKLDENISKIIQYSIQGWPKNKSSLPKNEIIRHFAKLKEKLMVSEDGLLYYDNRVVIPETLKSSALKSLHSGHMGIQKTILRAKETMYWINMNNNIESYIKKCLTCQTFRGQKMKEPLQPIEISNFPFERISLDILTYNSKDYLVVVDSYSKWIELYRLKSKKCSEIISKLKNLFGRLIRTKIPINSHKLKPISGLGKIHHSLKTKMRQSQLNQKKYYDKKTRLEKPFQSGENVLVREGERWIRGKIIQSTEYPRSYWVKTEKGSKVRRNTLHLKHTPIIFEDCDTPDNFDDFLEIHCYKKSDTASSDATLIDQDDLVVPNLSTNT